MNFLTLYAIPIKTLKQESHRLNTSKPTGQKPALLSPKTSIPNTDSWFEVPDEFTFSVSNSISLRVYADTRPMNLKIADLEKGLILMLDGVELVGEGIGFGVPIIRDAKNTFFSGTSRVLVSQQNGIFRIRKEYSMDRVSRETLGNARLENRKARVLIDYLSALYQRHRYLRFLSLKDLTSRLGIRARFVSVPSIGKVIVTYEVVDRKIRVHVDFGSISADEVETLFVLNEQSSAYFRTYLDSDGSRFFDDRIGAWEDVTAEWASVLETQRNVGFRLRKVANSVLCRGRESLRGSMDWIGLDYELARGTRIFEYEIDLLGA